MNNTNSLKFKNISKNTTKLMQTMLNNQNFLRYIYYLDKHNPLDENLPDVNPMEVRENNLTLALFNPEILEETKTHIFFYPLNGTFNSNNVVAEDAYALDILIPYDYWIIDGTGELRAFAMADEIANVIDQKRVSGIGSVRIVSWNTYRITNRFVFLGLSLIIKVKNPSITELKSNGSK